jgi:RNA polymerase sigma factor (TIGR02999 family)
MGDITALLQEARGGDSDKLAAVFAALYPQLKQLASWRAASLRQGDTLTPTAIVHETYLKLVKSRELALQDRRHFFACAARAMRQLIIDHARAVAAGKRGGGVAPVELRDGEGAGPPPEQWLDLDRALDALDALDPEQRELVELRYFAGLSREEVAELRGCSPRTVERGWARARAFLHARLAPPTVAGV